MKGKTILLHCLLNEPGPTPRSSKSRSRLPSSQERLVHELFQGQRRIKRKIEVKFHAPLPPPTQDLAYHPLKVISLLANLVKPFRIQAILHDAIPKYLHFLQVCHLISQEQVNFAECTRCQQSMQNTWYFHI